MTFWPSPPATVSSSDAVPSVGYNKHTDMGIHLKQRVDGLTPFTNSDAGALVYGDLLVQDAASGERMFKKSAASAGAAGPYFVALDAVAIAGTGYAAHLGHVDVRYTGTAPVAGDQLQASGTAGLAMVGTTNPFAIAYADGLSGTVQAILYGPRGAGGGGGGGSSSSNATWDPYGLAVAPVAADFSVHNNWSLAGTLTRLDQNADNLVLFNPASVSAVQQRGIFIPSLGAALTPPYTVRACMTPQFPEIDTWAFLLVLRNSSNDKRISIDIHRDSTHFAANSVLFTDQNTFSGSPGTDLDLTQGFPLWVQLRDNATNFYFEISRNGKDYQIVDSGSTGLHTTPDQAGITTDSYGGGSGGAGAVTLLSWEILNTA